MKCFYARFTKKSSEIAPRRLKYLGKYGESQEVFRVFLISNSLLLSLCKLSLIEVMCSFHRNVSSKTTELPIVRSCLGEKIP